MEAIFSKIDFTKIFATCLVARLILAGILTSPRLVGAVVVICVVMMLATWINQRISNIAGKEVKIMKIDLTSREAPTPGEQPGVFADVVETVQTDKRNKKSKYLVLTAELAATKSSGRRFTATTRFNVDDARGIRSLRENLQVWRGTDTLPDLTTFDPVAEFVGKTFRAEPTVHDEAGKREIRFSGFKPYSGNSPLTVSADFVPSGAPSAA